MYFAMTNLSMNTLRQSLTGTHLLSIKSISLNVIGTRAFASLLESTHKVESEMREPYALLVDN